MVLAVFFNMLRDSVLSLKHFGGISKVKYIFLLLVSAGNHGDELSCEESDELLQDPISFEATLFLSMIPLQIFYFFLQ